MDTAATVAPAAPGGSRGRRRAGPPPAALGPSPTPPAALGPRGIVLEPSGLPLAARDGEACVIEDDPAQREQQHRSIVAGDPDGLLRRARARARLPAGAVVAEVQPDSVAGKKEGDARGWPFGRRHG